MFLNWCALSLRAFEFRVFWLLLLLDVWSSIFHPCGRQTPMTQQKSVGETGADEILFTQPSFKKKYKQMIIVDSYLEK